MFTLLRSFLFLCLMFFYSFAALKMVDDFFRARFKSYLEDEYQQNKLKDPAYLEKYGNKNEGLKTKFLKPSEKLCSWLSYVENAVLYRSPLFYVIENKW